jgi:hypothetical protein
MFGDQGGHEDSAEWGVKDRQMYFSRKLWSTITKHARSSGLDSQIVMTEPDHHWKRAGAERRQPRMLSAPQVQCYRRILSSALRRT